MIVEDIMSRDPIYVGENSFLTNARQLVRDHHVRGLPVVDTHGRVKGIILNRDILRVTSSRSNVTVAGFTIQVPLLTRDVKVRDAARLMLTEQSEMLPVVKSPEEPVLRGVVSILDIFKHMDLSRLKKRPVREVMSTKVVTCSTKDPVTKVWDLMLESDFTGLPVLDEDGKPIGMITRFDILGGRSRIGKEDMSRSSDAMLMRAEKLMSTPLYFVKPGDDIVAAIGLMLKHEIGRVSVVDEGKLVGLVDRYDMIKSYLGE